MQKKLSQLINASKTIGDILRTFPRFLTQEGVEHSRKVIEYIVAHIFRMSRVQMYLNFEKPLTHEEKDQLYTVLLRILYGEPVQYVTGWTEFYGMRFTVTPDVLIPRPESELLVDIAVLIAPLLPSFPKLLDIGTGSGCLAIAVKKHLPRAIVDATDISPAALAIAQQNAKAHHCAINFFVHDIRTSTELPGKPYDLILSNPPYIAEQEYSDLPRTVREYEPRQALYGGKEGLDFYEVFATTFPALLSSDGFFLLEISPTVAEAVSSLFQRYPHSIFLDFQHFPRIILGAQKKQHLTEAFRRIPQYYQRWQPERV